MPVFDLRGTHGSGKSHIVHQLLAQYGDTPIKENGVLLGHRMPKLGNLAVVGPYTKVCGGCDAVKTQEEVCRRVRLFLEHYDRVLLEGSLVGHTYSRYAALADELKDYTFMFLNTPLASCIARVKSRRLERGNEKPFDPKNVIRDHQTTQCKLPAKFRANGYRVMWVDWLNPVETVAQIVQGKREDLLRAAL